MASPISVSMTSSPQENLMQFHIPDMTCGSCVPHVLKAVAKVDPDAKIDADTVARKVTVTTTASQLDIVKALADDGYPVTTI